MLQLNLVSYIYIFKGMFNLLFSVYSLHISHFLIFFICPNKNNNMKMNPLVISKFSVWLDAHFQQKFTGKIFYANVYVSYLSQNRKIKKFK